MTRRFAAIAGVVAACGCASPQPPPGGPPDAAPPRLLTATPDSGAVRVRPDEVVFRFDEVISEIPRGTELQRAVLVSPADGLPVVSWKRNALTVRPRRGWRPNTAYVVTLLPVIVDLRGNVREQSTVLVFSTGDSIPATRLSGAIFDWTRGTPAPRAYIEARPVTDTTLVSAAESDSVGRFVVPFLAPGEYVVRGILDQNRNFRADGREGWDSVRVTLTTSASVELYAVQRDTNPPRPSSVTLTDSVTVRVAFDRPLSPDSLKPPSIEVFGPDSARIAIARVLPWAELTERRNRAAQATRDSARRADTSSAARAAVARARQDSVNAAGARADSIARDTTKRTPPPVSSRPALVTELGVEFSTPLPAGARFRALIRAPGLYGTERVTERVFTTPRARADSGRFAPRVPPPPSRLPRMPVSAR